MRRKKEKIINLNTVRILLCKILLIKYKREHFNEFTLKYSDNIMDKACAGFTKLQKLEKETNKAMQALVLSATETQNLSRAAAKCADNLEKEACKISENIKSISESANLLAETAIAASKK